MKKLIFCMYALMASMALSAQIDYGVKAGINYSKNSDLTIFGGFTAVNERFSSERQIGFTAGVFAKASLSKFFVQPELLFTQTRSGYDGNPDLKISYLELPVLAGFNVFEQFSIYAGPSVQLVIDDTFSQVFDLDFDSKSVFAINIGAQFQVNKLGFDLRYVGNVSENLATYLDAIAADGLGYSINTKSDQWVISMSYQLN